MRSVPAVLLVLLVLFLSAPGAFATTRTVSLRSLQSSREIQTRSASNLDIEFFRGDERWATEVMSRIDAARRIVNRATRDSLLVRVRVVLVSNRALFTRLVGQWAENSVAVAISDSQEVVVNLEAVRASPAAAIEHVLVHELAHLYLGVRCEQPLPRWLNEGIAMNIAGEWSIPDAASVVMARTAGRLIPLRDLDLRFPRDAERQRLAYRQSYSVVRYLAQELPGQSVADIIHTISGPEGRFQIALYWNPLYRDAVEFRWHRSLKAPWNWALISMSSGLFWGLAVLLTFVAWYVRRRRSRRLHREWEDEERIYESLDEEERQAWGDEDPEPEHDPLDDYRREQDDRWRG